MYLDLLLISRFDPSQLFIVSDRRLEVLGGIFALSQRKLREEGVIQAD